MSRILLLSQQLLDRIVTDPDFKEFPCLANPVRTRTPARVAPTGRGCGGCGSKRRRRARQAAKKAANAVDHNEVKKALIAMPAEHQAALKARLDCTGLKIQWRGADATIQRRVI